MGLCAVRSWSAVRSRAALIAAAVRRLCGPGRGSALVIAGEAGIGKSRLAEHMSASAARAGVRVAIGRAVPAGLGGPLGPVAEVILDVTRGRPAPADQELAPYLAVLAPVVPHWRPPGWSAPAEPVVVTAEAVLRVLRWATEGRGVVVIAEDLHWADDATLAVTRYLADHADEVPIALLATVRTGEGRDDVADVLGSAGAQVCHLGRLHQRRGPGHGRRVHRSPVAAAGSGGGGSAGRRRAPAPGRGPAGHRRPGRDPAPVRGHRARPAGPPRRLPNARSWTPRRCWAGGSTGGCSSAPPRSPARSPPRRCTAPPRCSWW